MTVTRFTITGLLLVILLIHMFKNRVFGKLWAAMSGNVS